MGDRTARQIADTASTVAEGFRTVFGGVRRGKGAGKGRAKAAPVQEEEAEKEDSDAEGATAAAEAEGDGGPEKEPEPEGPRQTWTEQLEATAESVATGFSRVNAAVRRGKGQGRGVRASDPKAAEEAEALLFTDQWKTSDGTCVSITREAIRWPSGSTYPIRPNGTGKISAVIDGAIFYAKLVDGQLVWSDGDVWTKFVPVALVAGGLLLEGRLLLSRSSSGDLPQPKKAKRWAKSKDKLENGAAVEPIAAGRAPASASPAAAAPPAAPPAYMLLVNEWRANHPEGETPPYALLLEEWRRGHAVRHQEQQQQLLGRKRSYDNTATSGSRPSEAAPEEPPYTVLMQEWRGLCPGREVPAYSEMLAEWRQVKRRRTVLKLPSSIFSSSSSAQGTSPLEVPPYTLLAKEWRGRHPDQEEPPYTLLLRERERRFAQPRASPKVAGLGAGTALGGSGTPQAKAVESGRAAPPQATPGTSSVASSVSQQDLKFVLPLKAKASGRLLAAPAKAVGLPPPSPLGDSQAEAGGSLSPLGSLPLSRLKFVAKYHNISTQGCVEKADIVGRLESAGIGDRAAEETPDEDTLASRAAMRRKQWKPAFSPTPYTHGEEIPGPGSGQGGRLPGCKFGHPMMQDARDAYFRAKRYCDMCRRFGTAYTCSQRPRCDYDMCIQCYQAGGHPVIGP